MKGGPTNHECFENAFQGCAGQVFTTEEIKRKLMAMYPDFSEGAVLPNDHSNVGNEGDCWCAKTPKRIFDRVDRGKYTVVERLGLDRSSNG